MTTGVAEGKTKGAIEAAGEKVLDFLGGSQDEREPQRRGHSGGGKDR
ncbi:hypothetical protein [Prescottella equi]|nr:hypothetical protein [Prescottella equi]